MPRLGYPGAGAPVTLTVGEAGLIVPEFLDDGGDALRDCKIVERREVWPSDLSLDPKTCAVSGTPRLAAGVVHFSVIASNSIGDSVPAQLSLIVARQPTPVPVLSYGTNKKIVAKVGTRFALHPTVARAGVGPILACTTQIGSPYLPTGVVLNQGTCEMVGTLSEPLPSTALQIIAIDANGPSAPAAVELTGLADVPVLVHDLPEGFASTAVDAPFRLEPASLRENGAPILDCRAKGGSLPDGLTLDAETCVIEGTPTSTVWNYPLELEAINAAGASVASKVFLTIHDPVPTVGSTRNNGDGSWTTTFTGSDVIDVPVYFQNDPARNFDENYASAPQLEIRSGTADALLRFPSPPTPFISKLLTAELALYMASLTAPTPPPTMASRIRAIKTDWDPATIKGENCCPTIDTTFYEGLPAVLPVAGQWYAINLTTLAGRWHSGDLPNLGLYLTATNNNVRYFFESTESAVPEQRPTVKINYIPTKPIVRTVDRLAAPIAPQRSVAIIYDRVMIPEQFKVIGVAASSYDASWQTGPHGENSVLVLTPRTGWAGDRLTLKVVAVAQDGHVLSPFTLDHPLQVMPPDTVNNGDGTWTTTIQPGPTEAYDTSSGTSWDAWARYPNVDGAPAGFPQNSVQDSRSYVQVRAAPRDTRTSWIRFAIPFAYAASIEDARLEMTATYTYPALETLTATAAPITTDWRPQTVISRGNPAPTNPPSIPLFNAARATSCSISAITVAGETRLCAFDVTAVVQSWLDAPYATPYGFALNGTVVGADMPLIAFASGKAATAAHRPKLIVRYRPR